MVRVLLAIKQVLPDLCELIQRLCKHLSFILVLNQTAFEGVQLALNPLLLSLLAVH